MMKIKYISSGNPKSQKFDDYIKTEHMEFIKETNPDIILVSGGDGSMLTAINAYHQYNKPFFGHASGTVNFLMNHFEDYEETIKKVQQGNYPLHIIETTSIKVDLVEKGKIPVTVGYAVNDVVIGADVMGYHSYNISSEDKSFDGFLIKGTGISICTDLGSTAYNFNLGGPVLPLGSKLWVVEGIVCNRYLNDILPIQQLRIFCDKAKEANSLFLDGIRTSELTSGQTVLLSTGNVNRIAFLNEEELKRKRTEITSRFRKS